LIDQHTRNFYRSSGNVSGFPVLTFVRREIGRALISRIIEDNMDGIALLFHVSPNRLCLG
jgi:hypothetical protein